MIMRFGSNLVRHSLVSSCNTDEVKLKVTEQEKYLGIICDQNLSFEEHINTQIKKANGLAGMLRRSFEFMDKDMFKQLFTAIVRPHLEYGAPLWNPHTKNVLMRSKMCKEGHQNKLRVCLVYHIKNDWS